MLKQKLVNDLFDGHYNSLCYFANTFIKDQDVSEDIVQEAFIGLWNNLENITDVKEKSLAYLYRTIRNKSLNYIRDKKVREASQVNLRIEAEEWEEEHVNQLIRSEVIGVLHHSLEQLPTKCKQILKMAYIHGMSERDIAESLNVSVSTVKNHKKRGKKLIKVGLERALSIIMYL